jgi:hypothetical protein
MSAEDYGYESYDSMFRHAEHHGGSVDADSNVVEQVVMWLDELAALRATVTAQAERIAELEAVSSEKDQINWEWHSALERIAALEQAVSEARWLLTTLDR